MPVKCYSKPNRTTDRVFTARDAARVLCYAYNSGFTIDEFLEESQECVGNELRRIVEEKVRQLLCEALADKVEKARLSLARLNPIVRTLRTVYDTLDGLWSDVEDFRVFTVRVPRTITVPVRRLLDRIGELVENLENVVLETTDFIDNFILECENGESKDK